MASGVSELSACTILIVDDDPDDVFFSKRALKAAGFDHPVLVAGNGEDAIELLFGDRHEAHRDPAGDPTARIGLVLLDKRMPRLEGEALLWRMKADPRLAAIPVIMLTGLAEPALAARVVAAGALACLQKPLDAQALRAALGSLGEEARCSPESF
jgi:CheY-like chemotaxis protein